MQCKCHDALSGAWPQWTWVSNQLLIPCENARRLAIESITMQLLDCYFHIPDQLQFQPLYASCRTLQVDKSQDQTCASNLYQPDCKLDTCGTVSEYRGIEPIQHSIDQKSKNQSSNSTRLENCAQDHPIYNRLYPMNPSYRYVNACVHVPCGMSENMVLGRILVKHLIESVAPLPGPNRRNLYCKPIANIDYLVGEYDND